MHLDILKPPIAALKMVVAAAAAVAGCGDDNENGSGSGSDGARCATAPLLWFKELGSTDGATLSEGLFNIKAVC